MDRPHCHRIVNSKILRNNKRGEREKERAREGENSRERERRELRSFTLLLLRSSTAVSRVFIQSLSPVDVFFLFQFPFITTPSLNPNFDFYPPHSLFNPIQFVSEFVTPSQVFARQTMGALERSQTNSNSMQVSFPSLN